MKAQIIGRISETEQLESYYKSAESEFIAVYGRRRVGKTYLIRNNFEKFDFQYTAVPNSTRKEQLINFGNSLREQGLPDATNPKNWMEAFELLRKLLLQSTSKSKKIVFLDELPWMDKQSNCFIKALEYFWNSWASAENNIMLIVCGSGTSWMINKLINNHGGLHNRITHHIYLQPFTLKETEEYLLSRNFIWNRFMISECYMIMGGIPYYLSLLNSRMSLSQNIDNLFLKKNTPLKFEFNNLYASLFGKADNYVEVVEALGKKNKGLTREEIIKATSLANGGGLTTILNDLENCGFICKQYPFEKKKKNCLYQLVDFYTLFYFKFLKGKGYQDEGFWEKSANLAQHNAWTGYSFEQLCLAHIAQIKKKLGISGIISNNFSWRSKDTILGAQIDLVIDRNDKSVTICEMKYSINEYIIDKAYEKNLRNKIGAFQSETKTKKSIFLCFISAFGLKKNMYSYIAKNQVVLEDLFD